MVNILPIQTDIAYKIAQSAKGHDIHKALENMSAKAKRIIANSDGTKLFAKKS